MIGRVFFVLAALAFFFAVAGVHFLPNATAWGLAFMAVGLAVGGVSWTPWKRPGT